MKINIKLIVFLETALIAILLINTNMAFNQNKSIETFNYTYPLLASTINTGAMKSQSFTMFNFYDLQNYILQLAQDNKIDMSLYVENLRDGNNFEINGGVGSFPASLNKIPIAVLILNKIEKGELNYDTLIKIDKTLLTNSSDQIYFKNNWLPIKVLLEKMLKESDNTAFFLLFKNINMTDLNNLMFYYGMDAKRSYYYESGMEHNVRLTPKSFSNMFRSLYYSTVLKANDSEYILELLSNTTFKMNKIAQIPDNVTVSHKWGGYNDSKNFVFNDCGIMYISNGRVLYCASIRNESEQSSIIIDVVNAIYNFYINETSLTN